MATGGGEPLPDDLGPMRTALLEWYEANRRELPWRDTKDPYAILVGEVMSQQTQLGRVIEPFEEFLERWATVEELAAADPGTVIAFWSEHRLGYNRRARYLHEAAIEVVEERNGRFPREPAELEELMGVGPYTANAVASFAFNNGNAVVDTNVKRILYRVFDIPDDEDTFRAVANDLLPTGSSRVWNNAIMECGGLVCQSQPRCDEGSCPLRRWCSAYHLGDFTAPDVPTQPPFEGSRRQYRGRVIRTLGESGDVALAELGSSIRDEYGADGADEQWLLELLSDLESDGLIEIEAAGETVSVRLWE